MNRKRLLSIAAGIAVLLAFVVGIGVYHAPTNRLNRHLELANKYLVEMNYEQAIVEFDKAIEIDSMNAAAYLGKAEAYVGMGDNDRAIETLETGYLATQENGEVKSRLIAVYKEVLKVTDAEKRYEEKLAIYDRLIELDGNDKDVLDDLENCLEQYIKILLDEEKSDEVRALIKKYKDILAGTNFDAFVIQAEMRLKEIEYSSLLKTAQDVILAEDYEQLNTLIQEKEYQDMIASLQMDESYYYGERNPAGQRDGTGFAVYKGYVGTNFYYGSWSEGERTGMGLSVQPYPDGEYVLCGIYSGEWAHDLPNGYGEDRWPVIQSRIEECSGVPSLNRGFLKDGFFDGEMYREIIWPGGKKVGYQGKAKNGVLQGEESEGIVSVFTPVTDSSMGKITYKVEDIPRYWGVSWVLPSAYWEGVLGRESNAYEKEK